MKTATPLLSNHGLARLTRWAQLWLDWFVWAFYAQLPLFHPGRQDARHSLDRAAGLVRSMLIIQACRGLRRPSLRPRYGRARARAGTLRTVAGARLRRAFKGASAFERLAAMHAALRDPSLHLAALVARIRRGFTRRRGGAAPQRMPPPALGLVARAPCPPDTS